MHIKITKFKRPLIMYIIVMVLSFAISGFVYELGLRNVVADIFYYMFMFIFPGACIVRIGIILYNKYYRDWYILFSDDGVTDYLSDERLGFIAWNDIDKVLIIDGVIDYAIELMFKNKKNILITTITFKNSDLYALLKVEKIHKCKAIDRKSMQM